MAPLAMEMVRDIDEETVDFKPNYDGRAQEPTILPSRFPNLLVNGSSGIAVGMATNIPPHNLREVADGVQWALAQPGCVERGAARRADRAGQGPGLPHRRLIVGRARHRGCLPHRPRVDHDARGRRGRGGSRAAPAWSSPSCRTRSTRTTCARRSPSWSKDGKVTGIADLRDESSGRTGQRLVIVLKRDAVAKVVLNNLYKHTQLQETFGANMLALVDGVPRTLRLDAVRHATGSTTRSRSSSGAPRYRLRKAEERAHILRGLAQGPRRARRGHRADPPLADRRRGADRADGAAGDRRDPGHRDPRHAAAPAGRPGAAEDHRRVRRARAEIADFQAILANEARQRAIVREELGEIVDKYGDERRTRIMPVDGDGSDGGPDPEAEVVVTITRGGYAKRTEVDAVPVAAPRRQGGARGDRCSSDDIVDHFFVTTTHHWILFFTNLGRVYRAKAYELPETGARRQGPARGQPAGVPARREDRPGAGAAHYEQAPYLVLATKHGLVKKTALTEYDTNRTGGLIAVNLKDGDELVSARLVDDAGELIMVSAKGMSTRFGADSLRAMGRSTSGVIGMRFRDGDELLAMDTVRPGCDLVTVTEEGYAKRTDLGEWNTKGRGGLGVRAMRLVEERGCLVAAMVCEPDDSIFAIASNGVVIRTPVADVRQTGRDTMGVSLMGLPEGVTVVAVARAEAEDDVDDDEADPDATDDPAPEAVGDAGDDGESAEASDEKE